MNYSKLLKGEADGHPFRGNQYTENSGSATPAPVRDHAAERAAEQTRLKKFFAPAAKEIGFPSGAKVEMYSDSMNFRSRGGHGGRAVVDRVMAKAREAGWTKQDSSDTQSPDGSSSHAGTTLVSPTGWTLYGSSTYGSTAYDNRFSLTLRPPADKTKENPYASLYKKGEADGHPFRGNQYTDGGATEAGVASPEHSQSIIRDALTGNLKEGHSPAQLAHALPLLREELRFVQESAAGDRRPDARVQWQGKADNLKKVLDEVSAKVRANPPAPPPSPPKAKPLEGSVSTTKPSNPKDALDRWNNGGRARAEAMYGKGHPKVRAAQDDLEKKARSYATRQDRQFAMVGQRVLDNGFAPDRPKRKYAPLLKGESDGHPFRGNQYTAGTGDAHPLGPTIDKITSAAQNNKKVVDILRSADFGMSEKGGNGRAFFDKGTGEVVIHDPFFYTSNSPIERKLSDWKEGGSSYKYFQSEYGLTPKITGHKVEEYNNKYQKNGGYNEIRLTFSGGAKKEDMTLDGVPKKNPAPMFGKKFKRRIQGLDP